MKILVINEHTVYKQIFETFMIPNIHLRLGKKLTQGLNSHNTSVVFYKYDSDSTSIRFEYTLSKISRLSLRTLARLREKLKDLNCDVDTCENFNSEYPFKYTIKGGFIE